MLRRTFDAMGTRAELVLHAPDGPGARVALAAARREVEQAEARWSRFRPGSELSRLNAAGGGRPGPLTAELVVLALQARAATGGRYDPTVGAAMRAAGYDRPMADGLDDPRPAPPAPAGPRRVDLTPDGELVLGPGVQLDLGGIAKGWTAERAADRLVAAGPCLVSIGGDMAVRGLPDSGHWPVEVPTAGASLVVGLAARGLATSGVDRRRWRRGGRAMHHVIDPATGRPADTDLVRVTCIARDAVSAETWATALLLAGSDRARAECERMGLPAVLTTTAGTTVLAGGVG